MIAWYRSPIQQRRVLAPRAVWVCFRDCSAGPHDAVPGQNGARARPQRSAADVLGRRSGSQVLPLDRATSSSIRLALIASSLVQILLAATPFSNCGFFSTACFTSISQDWRSLDALSLDRYFVLGRLASTKQVKSSAKPASIRYRRRLARTEIDRGELFAARRASANSARSSLQATCVREHSSWPSGLADAASDQKIAWSAISISRSSLDLLA